MKDITRILSILLVLLSPLMDADALDPFEVRIVYFRPLDALPAPVDRITQLMQETQEFYASEMERSGFGNKTFDVETLNNKMVVHTVDGAHNADHYFANTYQQMERELPREFTFANVNSHDNIHVFIVGGLDLVYGGVLGVGWTFSGWRAGGNAVLPGDRLNMPIIAHEVGHAFGLFHNNVNFTMMGPFHGKILDYEARWLSRLHYFNDKHIRTDIPRLIEHLPFESVGGGIIRLKFAVQSESGLYHSKIIRERGGYLVLGNDNLSGKNDVGDIHVSRAEVIIGDLLSFRILDVNGNYIYENLEVKELPLPMPNVDKTKNGNKNPDLDQDKNINEDPDLDEDELIDNECPGCRPDKDNEVENTDLGISYQNKLTIQWASLKKRR